MKRLPSIIGIVLIVIGILWILQGTNIIKGGPMGGQVQWAIVGVVAILLGGTLMVLANRRPKGAPVKGNPTNNS